MSNTSNTEQAKILVPEMLKLISEHGVDLHICPKSAPLVRSEKAKGIYAIRKEPLDIATVKAIINDILTTEQKNEFQRNKHIDFSFTYEDLGRFKACVYMQRGTPALTIRTLPFEVPDFNKLGLPEAVKDVAFADNGLIIVAGGYSSGKSTTLAAIVDLINTEQNRHITTIEKPIEYLHRHKKGMVVQKEIGSDVFDCFTAIEQLHGENADVVMIGEPLQPNYLSVMELAEERLVLIGLRSNCTDVVDIARSIRTITKQEAERRNINVNFVPMPKLSVIYQELQTLTEDEKSLFGKFYTLDIDDNAERECYPIAFGGGENSRGN